MIEVEKRFHPTEEQTKIMLQGAEFLGESVNHDIYYDYPDVRFLKKDIRLRNRNGSFELKIGKGSSAAEEIDDKKEIEKYFSMDKNLEDFIKENMIVVMEYSNNRKSYTKEGFNIVLDEMSFDYSMCEIELMVTNEGEIEQAKEKILDFAKKFGLETKKTFGKCQAYLNKFKPEIYKQVYGDK
ncbi:MAG: hypothetical protein QG583_188 [Patescibacteria group bacterium]|nr:hypothetical protein [Patescibacteria group bacterium]